MILYLVVNCAEKWEFEEVLSEFSVFWASFCKSIGWLLEFNVRFWGGMVRISDLINLKGSLVVSSEKFELMAVVKVLPKYIIRVTLSCKILNLN